MDEGLVPILVPAGAKITIELPRPAYPAYPVYLAWPGYWPGGYPVWPGGCPGWQTGGWWGVHTPDSGICSDSRGNGGEGRVKWAIAE